MKNMRFRILLFFVLSFTSSMAWAVEQDSDTLIWNDRKYALLIDWRCPSVMQIYFQRKDIKSPFTTWSSNNNRGHVATFELREDGLYLLNIEAKRFRTRKGNLWTETGIDTVAVPDFFGVKPLFAAQPFDDDAVLADWFSGVIELVYIPKDKKDRKNPEANGSRFLYVRNGRVVSNLFITPKERARIESEQKHDDVIDVNAPQPFGGDRVMQQKAEMLFRHWSYVCFYYRGIADRENVTMNGHRGHFEHNDFDLPLVMKSFDNDPMGWVYNWEKESFQGVPIGTWVIRNDSIFLVSVAIHGGLEPYKYSMTPVPLDIAFSDTLMDDGTLLAGWLNGEYVIQYGNESVDDYGIPQYTVYKTQRIRVKNGVILSSQYTPRSFEEDAADEEGSDFAPCNAANIWSVDDKQLAEVVGAFNAPKKTPSYLGDKPTLRGYFVNHPLTDDRVKDRLFRVRIGFMVNCNGEAGNWQIISKGKGELHEFAQMVLELVKAMPQNWIPAEDKRGNKVDCWQYLEFTVNNGVLTNANYK